jgi:methyl-accepting chemotaxis protein
LPILGPIGEVCVAIFSAIPISKKLPLIIVALCLAACTSIAFVSYAEFKRNIIKQKQNSFSILAEARRDELTHWFGDLESAVVALGGNSTVVSAANGFGSSYNLMIDSAGLQAAYITNNPHPRGARDQLEKAPEQVPYHFQHASFHPFFREASRAEGFDDLLLFNADGELIYSVGKEPDFATNFASGPYANSILGQTVIPPFLVGLSRRIQAAVFSFIAGVMPPMPMLGRSLL